MTKKDWIGNSKSAFATLGARNIALSERASNDYYATDPKAAWLLMEQEVFSHYIWECACGEGHLAKEFDRAGYNVYATDLVDRGYGTQSDFLRCLTPPHPDCDIITNPPYAMALEFVEHAIDIVGEGRKVAMFLKIQFLEGKARRALFDKTPPKVVYVCSGRMTCAPNGDFKNAGKSSSICYAWYLWEKGFTGDTILKWIN